MLLDIRELTFYVPNLKGDFEKRSAITNICRKFGLNCKFIPAVDATDKNIGKSLSNLKILKSREVKLPMAIMSDDCVFNEHLEYIYHLPDDVDAFYLGQSRFGIEHPGKFSWGKYDHINLELYSPDFIQIYNNLAGHCIIYMSKKYLDQAIEANYNSMFKKNYAFPASIEYAILQNDFKVLSSLKNASFQSQIFGGNQSATTDSIYALKSTDFLNNLSLNTAPNDFRIHSAINNSYYLFYDVFVHWDRKKITAVAPYYGEDLDLHTQHENIILRINELEIKGEYIPCRLDSYEPTIIIDWQHPELSKILLENDTVDITIVCGEQKDNYRLATYHPRYAISMAVIIKNENKWINLFLDYYLEIMKVDHVYLYDNFTEDFAGLKEKITPYIKSGKVTYIPWHYRWRNKIDLKQIGQPPQEAHSLNKYGAGDWIGFFDVDEFLKIPGKTLPTFLKEFDPTHTGGVSFGLRWFFYKGSKDIEQIKNPLLEFVYSKRDPYGRKKQKLMVSPKCCRYCRFHWIPDDQKEHVVDDEKIYFHHYSIRKFRFDEFKHSEGETDHSLKETYENYQRSTTIKNHIDLSFANAKKEESKINLEVKNIEGYLGNYTRHLYNNLASLAGTRLLEIGLWKGASTCCFLKNNWIEATLIDNWSEFGGPKNECISNIRRHSGPSRIEVIEEDCFKIDIRTLGKYNLYSYDGNQSYDSHYKAIIHFYDGLDDVSIIIVDDWNRKHVRAATLDALRDLNISVFYEKEIILNEEDLIDMPRHKGKDHWWDGIYVFGINKKLKK